MRLVKSPSEWADRILDVSWDATTSGAVQIILDDWTWSIKHQERLKFADSSGFTIDGLHVPLHLLYRALARCATIRRWPEAGRMDLEFGSLSISDRYVEYVRVGDFCSAHVDGGLFRICPVGVLDPKNQVVRNTSSDSAAGLDRQRSNKIVRLNLIDNVATTQGETMSDTENGRLAQFTTGGKTGLKKGAIKVASEKVAQKIVSALPIPAKKPVERITQLGLLMGAAEVIRQMPDKVGSKIGLTKERIAAMGCEAYEMSGEIVGRDAVDLAQHFAPMFAETLKQLTASEITDAASELQNEKREEESASAAAGIPTGTSVEG